jgi:hypothetical protein
LLGELAKFVLSIRKRLHCREPIPPGGFWIVLPHDDSSFESHAEIVCVLCSSTLSVFEKPLGPLTLLYKQIIRSWPLIRAGYEDA